MKKSRAYNAESRRKQAKIIRHRILSKSTELFASKGFDCVTIPQLAQRADVSESTIYALFKSKRGILRALIDAALPKEERSALVKKVSSETSAEKRLDLAASIARQLYDAEKKQMDLLRGATILHPEFKTITAMQEKRRYKRQADTVKSIAQNNVFKENMTISQIQDVLWALTGRDIYRLLVLERGWSSDAYEKWLSQLLKQALLRKTHC